MCYIKLKYNQNLLNKKKKNNNDGCLTFLLWTHGKPSLHLNRLVLLNIFFLFFF